MDAHPELRLKTITEPVLDEATGKPMLREDGKPLTRTRQVRKTPADVKPMPDPKTGKTNAQRKTASGG
jgi:hypothetical protein